MWRHYICCLIATGRRAGMNFLIWIDFVSAMLLKIIWQSCKKRLLNLWPVNNAFPFKSVFWKKFMRSRFWGIKDKILENSLRGLERGRIRVQGSCRCESHIVTRRLRRQKIKTDDIIQHFTWKQNADLWRLPMDSVNWLLVPFVSYLNSLSHAFYIRFHFLRYQIGICPM
jgi:hypothetical protein